MKEHRLKDCPGKWKLLQAKGTSYGGEMKVFYFYCDKCLAIVRKELEENETS